METACLGSRTLWHAVCTSPSDRSPAFWIYGTRCRRLLQHPVAIQLPGGRHGRSDVQMENVSSELRTSLQHASTNQPPCVTGWKKVHALKSSKSRITGSTFGTSPKRSAAEYKHSIPSMSAIGDAVALTRQRLCKGRTDCTRPAPANDDLKRELCPCHHPA